MRIASLILSGKYRFCSRSPVMQLSLLAPPLIHLHSESVTYQGSSLWLKGGVFKMLPHQSIPHISLTTKKGGPLPFRENPVYHNFMWSTFYSPLHLLLSLPSIPHVHCKFQTHHYLLKIKIIHIYTQYKHNACFCCKQLQSFDYPSIATMRERG